MDASPCKDDQRKSWHGFPVSQRSRVLYLASDLGSCSPPPTTHSQGHVTSPNQRKSSDMYAWPPESPGRPVHSTFPNPGGTQAPFIRAGEPTLSTLRQYDENPSPPMEAGAAVRSGSMTGAVPLYDPSIWSPGSRGTKALSEHSSEASMSRGRPSHAGASTVSHPRRRPANRDEFDGPHQLLEPLPTERMAAQDQDLPHVPTNLLVQEQDEVLSQVHDRLSQCAFDFIAKYQFPIPIEPDKRPVSVASDREWNEWVQLLRRLATKRRIPARVLYNGQIKQLVTVLENSLEMRHAAKHQSRPLKDDRNVLQLISAGIQVAKMLKDASVMQALDDLYVRTENVIRSRKSPPRNHR